MKKTPIKIFIIFSLILILLACMPFPVSYPITGHDLRENPHGMVEFSVNEDYLTVYRRIMLASKACYGAKPFRVDGEFFQDKNAAEITIASIIIVYIAAIHISIRATSNNVTSISTYYAPGLSNEWKAAADDTKQWANGNANACQRKP